MPAGNRSRAGARRTQPRRRHSPRSSSRSAAQDVLQPEPVRQRVVLAQLDAGPVDRAVRERDVRKDEQPGGAGIGIGIGGRGLDERLTVTGCSTRANGTNGIFAALGRYGGAHRRARRRPSLAGHARQR